ncbi:Oligopeptide transport ATP-binding protein OppF [compost metagenome]
MISLKDSQSSIFALRDVGKSYALGRTPVERLFNRKRFHAVSSVNLNVNKGDSFAIVGESGSGKSTMARLMVGLIKPTVGSILYKGRSLSEMTTAEEAAYHQQVQLVFQSNMSSFNPRKTIFTTLKEAIGPQGVPIAELMEMVQLPTHLLSRYPHQLSGGQRQRVGIARALARRPEVVIADEPTSALDVSIQAEIIKLLRDLHGATGLTLIVISHDLALVAELCRNVAVMRNGSVVEVGPSEKVLFTPADTYTEKLLASIPKGIRS